MKTCIVPECDSDRFCRGMCAKHYFRWKSSGRPMPEAPYTMRSREDCPSKVLVDPELREERTQSEKPCAIPGCSATCACRGLCRKHHAKWRRSGVALPVAPYVPLSPEDCPPDVLVDGRRRKSPSEGNEVPPEWPDSLAAEARSARPLYRPTIDATPIRVEAVERESLERVQRAVRALYAARWRNQWVGDADHPTREDIVDGELERAAAVAGLLPGGN